MQEERKRIEARIPEIEHRIAELDPPTGGRTFESEDELYRLLDELKQCHVDLDTMDRYRT